MKKNIVVKKKHNMPENIEIENVMTSGNNESFSRLINDNIDMIRKMVFRIILNEHDTDDIVQETFITAYEKIHMFKRKAKFSTWLCRIAYNKAYAFLRNSRGKINEVDMESASVEQLNSGKSHEQPDRRIVSKEMSGTITRALLELPEKLRAAITMVAIEEVPIEEVAYIMKCPKATVYWRLHKARKILNTQLGELL